MKKINTLLSRPITQYLIITILAVLYAFNATPVIFPDSKGYIEMWLVRSYGYPFFLAFHKMLFGNYFITTVIFSQFIINIVAIFFLMRCIRALVPLKQWIAFILYAVLIFPAFFGTALAKTILSESLAYPLYLGVIGYLLKGIFLKQNKYFYFALLLSFGAITVRGQFLFLIPLILIAVLLTFYKFLFNRKTFLLMISCIATPFLLVYSDITFHKIVHHQAVATPWTGIQILSMPFFVADKNDDAVFKTKEQKAFFRYVYKKLEEKDLLYSQLLKENKKIEFTFDNYVKICNQTICGNGIEMFPAEASLDQKIIWTDKITTAMTLPLLKDNFKKWFSVYTANFIKGFDTSKHFLLLVILTLTSLVMLFKKENIISKFILLLTLATIGNVAIVAIAEPTISRYVFYNNWIVIAIVLILFQNTFYVKPNE